MGELLHVLFFLLVLVHNELILFTRMRQDDNSAGDLLTQFVQLLVTLLDLLVQSLVLNLELLVINQVKTICELILLAKNFLFVGKLVAKGDILQSVLVHLLVFRLVSFFPLLDSIGREFLTSSAEYCIHGDTLLKFFELLLNLHTLLLLFIELVLQLTRHTIVAILGFLQVVTNLMHVCQSIEVLMLVKHLVSWFVWLLSIILHQNDFLLELFV